MKTLGNFAMFFADGHVDCTYSIKVFYRKPIRNNYKLFVVVYLKDILVFKSYNKVFIFVK